MEKEITYIPYTPQTFGDIMGSVRYRVPWATILLAILAWVLYSQPVCDPEPSKYLWLLDAGHGCETHGKRSPMLEDSTHFYEYQFNRKVVGMIAKGLDSKGISYRILVPEDSVGNFLDGRVWRTNQIKQNNKMLISIHANADGKGDKWTDANGAEVYHLEGDKVGKMMAKSLNSYMEDTGLKNRGVKTANFRVLKGTDCPAILSENGFYTNKKELGKLQSPKFQARIAQAHLRMILDFERP